MSNAPCFQSSGGFDALTARGRLNEMLTSLRCLQALLRSPNVGYRPLGRFVRSLVRSDVFLGVSIVNVIDTLQQRHEPLALQPLRSLALDALQSVQQALETTPVPLRALGRLKLEAAVSYATARIAMITDLLMLLLALEETIPTTVCATSILYEAQRVVRSAHRQSDVSMRPSDAECEPEHQVTCDPRAVLQVIACATRLLTLRGHRDLSLQGHCDERHFHIVCQGESLPAAARLATSDDEPLLAHSAELLIAAAKYVPIDITAPDSEPAVRMRVAIAAAEL